MKKKIVTIAGALLLHLLLTGSSMADSVQQASITLIIDDMGNSLDMGMRAIKLPGPVTYAILPYSPHSENLAKAAHANNKEVMLHMPMANIDGRPLGPGALTGNLDRATFKMTFEKAIRAIPYLQGVNNHMGSRLTQYPEQMAWIMETLNQHSLYFVDSRTSHASVAGNIARRDEIPNLDRDVFLDHDPDPQAIDEQFKRLLQLAKLQGSAVAIGHPYPSTLGYLENVIPKLDAMGFRLVSPKGLLVLRRAASMKRQQTEESPRLLTAMPNPGQCVITEQLERRRVTCS